MVVSGGGRQVCIKHRAGWTTFSTRSYERCDTFNTTASVVRNIQRCFRPQTCAMQQSGVENGTAAVRAWDNRPSHQQHDRQTVWQWGRGSGQQLVAACAGLSCWPQGLPMVAECLGLEADPCWLKWWCKFPAAKRAEPTNWWTTTPETQSHVSSKHLCQLKERG